MKVMNMSYCRFQNTLKDLTDCYDNLDDTDLSEEEARARYQLIELCIEIVENYGNS
jgi:hypothetical protein